MYFNSVHILIYVLVAFFGFVIGRFVSWSIYRLPEKKKVLSFEYFSTSNEDMKGTYIYMFLIAIIYVALLYRFGIDTNEVLKNLELVKFIILAPMLVVAGMIDLKHRILPNRINLTIFETGLIITFIYGITNVNMAKEYILGMIFAAAIFGIITLLGYVVSGKEAMGLGDVKFIAAVGLFFGESNIIEVILVGFFIAAILSIFVWIVRLLILKKKDEYVPFGPFLVIASFICMFVPSGVILDYFLNMCQLISNKILL